MATSTSNNKQSTLKTLWRENKSFVFFLLLMFVFRSAVADWNDVPTGSMKPTIVEGDRIYVDKMAYDIRVPFTLISLYKIADPQRGEIIIFDSEASDKRLVKRVIGVPGDKVSMFNNQLWVNGQAVNYESTTQSAELPMGYSELTEALPGQTHKVRVADFPTQLSSFAEVVVPENSYLAMGDNRDNSADSRVIGFVPRHEIVGKSEHVVLSLDYANYFLPRTERFFAKLDG